MQRRLSKQIPNRFTYRWMMLVYGISALGAYQLFFLPMQWLGSAALLLPFCFLPYKGARYPSLSWFPVMLVLLMCFVSLLGWLVWAASIDFTSLLPAGASTSYPVFITLRYFQLAVFAMVYLLTLSFLQSNGPDRLVDLVVAIGVIAALYAIYVYVAQLLGLAEIPRSRMGTGGQQQSVVFSYVFHRALGSFREPSHLAEWLVLPFFLTYWRTSAGSRAARVLVAFVILLTGSLTGIVSIVVGYLIAVVMVFPLKTALRRTMHLALVLAVCAFLVFLFAASYSGDPVNIVSVLLERLGPILEGGGLAASNRDYVYEFAAQNSVPLLGYGFGNANLLLSEYMGSELVVSFLNLYLNALYALGYPGLVLVAAFFAFPLLTLPRTKGADRSRLFALSGAYIAWLLVFLAHSEELSVSFGVLYAACMYYYLACKGQPVRYGLRPEAGAG